MQAYVDRGVMPASAPLVARRGVVVHAGQFGWRDKEAQSPMAADTIFRLYSMTKPIACVGLMTLYEEGRFQLIDSVAKYIPAFGGVKVLGADGELVDPVRPIFARDLMTHTSGLTYLLPLGREVGRGSRRPVSIASAPLPAALNGSALRRRRDRPHKRAGSAAALFHSPNGNTLWRLRLDAPML
jgi:CubicO group peptidase (beta-lactamase class C family)